MNIDGHGKTQLIRLLDVVFIGPMMVWGGLKLRGPGGYTLALLGIATVVYNGHNYVRLSDR